MSATPPSSVHLVFPALVETSFGKAFPSTAVLAASLGDRPVEVHQHDLNTPFLAHLVSDDELTCIETGARDMRSVAAARWVRRHLAEGSTTLDELRGALDVAGHPLDPIVRRLVTSVSVDPDRRVIDGCFDDEVALACHRRYADAVAERFRGDGVLLVGISVPMGPQLLPALLLARAVRELRPAPSVRIVLGGPTLSLMADHDVARLLRHHPSVDAVVRFDGEGPLCELVDQLLCGDWRPEQVPGVSCRSSDGSVQHVAPARGPDLDDLATPRYDPDVLDVTPETTLGVLQARGCYWGKCDYCDFVEVYQGSPQYRSRRASTVVGDVRRLVEDTGIRRFRVITEAIPASFARSFSQQLIDERLDIRWSSFVMVDPRFDVGLFRQLVDSGCEFLVVGLESMTTRALQLVHKASDREMNLRFLRDARDAGLRLSVNLIPDLPSTTYDEAMAGLRDLEAVADCLGQVKVFEFEATRSSNVGRAPGSFGLSVTGGTEQRHRAQLALNHLVVRDPAMTPLEHAKVIDGYRSFASSVNGRSLRLHEDLSGRLFSEVLRDPAGPVLIDLVRDRVVRFPSPSRRATTSNTSSDSLTLQR